MSDLSLNIEDGVGAQDEAQVQLMNGADHDSITPGNIPLPGPAPEQSIPGTLDFILGQMPLHEQMGFLRGCIMMFSARLGTPDQQPHDADQLDQFNFLFQTRLREMLHQQQSEAERQQANMENMRRQADLDARNRGFKDSDDMGVQMKTAYESIGERIRQWHASTEPGGDETLCPDTNALLYDVYLAIEGIAR